jgi:lon-related putative ATP-dependent protease
MSQIEFLPADKLFTACDPGQFTFDTTADLDDLSEVVGQDRVLEALEFGVSMPHAGYNLYVLGPSGMGKHTIVRQVLEQKAGDDENPSDWCYVNNFADEHKPGALQLPAGLGKKFRDDMEHLLDELRSSIPSVFESDDYRVQLQQIEDELNERQEQAFKTLQEEAEKSQISLLRTPRGFAFAPMRDGEVIKPEEFKKLPEEEQQEIEKKVGELQEKLQKVLLQFPQWRKEGRQKVKDLNAKVTMFAVGMLLNEVRKEYDGFPELLKYLEALQSDIVEHVDDFRPHEKNPLEAMGLPGMGKPSFHRYKVNLLVDHIAAEGSPVVYEDNPTYQNLVGQVEHLAQMGALVTDFSLIKAGALHRANGGYLILDVRKLLVSPYAWEGLKRALYSRKVTIESLGQLLSLVSTVTLEPEPIPLNVKVVLLGERLLYYLLYQFDPDFRELFKVAADFEDEIDRHEENNQLYARLVATMIRQKKLLPFDRSAVGRVIEHSARMVADAEKLSTHLHSLADLLQEADYQARRTGKQPVTATDVQQAIDGQIRRADRVRNRVYENIQRGIILIDTEGEKVAQVNGLSVIQLGDFMFGQPSRITATARLGAGKVIDIEREVKLGGALHSKGVLIISSFLADRYARDKPLSLSASLVFEQSYGRVDGDSASVAELCALISALIKTPIKQSLAVTGSVNQQGQVQAIGGVNEKIEGFFDICRSRGLTGSQGVLIPAANVKHLMLRQDVVDAVREEKFQVYPVETVDQAIGLLTGVPAGEPDGKGDYPLESINGKMISRLEELSRLRQEFSEVAQEKGSEKEI